MQMKRQTEKQILNKVSKEDLDRELAISNIKKNKNTRQSTILEYVNKVR